jgi:hypothetical protein
MLGIFKEVKLRNMETASAKETIDRGKERIVRFLWLP